MRWARHVARMGEGRKVYRVLMGKPDRKRPLERPRSRWGDGIKMDLRETGWGRGGGVDSPDSGWGPVAGCCERGDEPSGSDATELVILPLQNVENNKIVRTLPNKFRVSCLYRSAMATFQHGPRFYSGQDNSLRRPSMSPHVNRRVHK
jgi:hypothetical protein